MRKSLLVLLLPLVLISCAGPSTGPSETEEPSFKTYEVFFVTDTPKGFRLVSEKRELVDTNQEGLDIFASLVNGELQPLDPDYLNLWTGENVLLSYTYEENLITIDLAPVRLNVGAEAEARAIEQIVWTVTAANGDYPVQFTVDGVPVETFAGHVDTQNPFTRAETYEVLNDLQIVSPNQSDVLSNPVIVTGMACTFEANVVWEVRLVDDPDTLIDGGSTTAKAACPERSSFEIELGELAAGQYSVMVMDYSAKDGSLSSVDSKIFFVE